VLLISIVLVPGLIEMLRLARDIRRKRLEANLSISGGA